MAKKITKLTKRFDGRRNTQLRPVSIETDFIKNADGSCLISFGDTRVICTASVVNSVPQWMEGKGRGWVTAEYGMLPASTSSRKRRPIGKADGRSTEIQRIIGRVLRGIVNFEALGENTIYLDCDVIQADGGTRTASITGAFVALARAIKNAQEREIIPTGKKVLTGGVSAISVGVVDSTALLDLNYHEDSRAETDMNIAMTTTGKYVEVQGSAEAAPFSHDELLKMLTLAKSGCKKLSKLQKQAINSPAGKTVRM